MVHVPASTPSAATSSVAGAVGEGRRPPRRIGVLFGHVASNIGDLAINRGQVAMLRQAFPDAELHVVYFNADKSAYLDDARASFELGGRPVRSSLFKSHSELALAYVADPARFLGDCGLADADLIVLSAGEHLFHYQHGENLATFFWRTLPALAAKVAGKACLMMPSTLGPFEVPESVGLARCLLSLVDRYAVRDARSGPLLQVGLGLAQAPEVLLDPAFFLPPPAPVARRDGGTAALVMRSENWGIRRAKADRVQPELEAVRDSAAYVFSHAFALKWLSESGRRLQVFVQTDADATLASALAADLAVDDRLSVVRPGSIDEYLAHLAAVDTVVASRFHAIILGAVAGKPGWGVYFSEHGHKMPGLFDLLGVPERCARLTSANAAQLGQDVAGRAASGAAGQDALEARLAALRQETLQWLAGASARPLAADALIAATRAYGGYSAKVAQDGMRAASDKKLADAAVAAGALRKRVAAAEADIARVRAEASKREAEQARQAESLKKSHADAMRVLADRAQQRTERLLRAERDQWASTLAYRAGNVLVESLRRPWRWPLLPLLLFREWRRFRADQARRLALAPPNPQAAENVRELEALMGSRLDPSASHGKAVSAKSAAISDETVLRLFRDGGVEAVVERLSTVPGIGDPKAVAAVLLQRGKALHERGETKIELALARAALARDGSVATLRGVFWAAQRADDYALACDAILRIEATLGTSPSEPELRALAQLKSSPAYQLSSLGLVEQGRPRAYEPVPKRVCYLLHNSLPFSSGGYATRSHGVAGGLQAQGYEVVCITRPGFPFDIKDDLKPADVPMEATIEGVRYQRIASPASKGISVPNYVAQSADVLEKRFRELRPEIVIAASNYRIGLMAMIAASRLGIPFIYEVRGWWELTRMSRDNAFVETPSFVVQNMLERAVANMSGHVFTLTEPMRETLIEQGAREDQVTLLPNSCDPERFLPIARDDALAAALGVPDGVPVIGYVGTFVDYEGLEDLAEACGLLAKRGQPFRLLLVGNENTSGQDRGPITSQIIETAQKWGFSDWLIMPGRVPHDEVERYYSLIDVAPFPRKPWPVCEMVSPMKPLEALAMEKAVVASDVRALAEMIQDDRTGLLFRKGDTGSLADVLQRLIGDPALRARLGRAGREWVSAERTWNGVGERAAGIVSRVVQGDG